MFVIWARREDINCISIGQINELKDQCHCLAYMICSVFVVFFLQNCLCIKFSFLKPTFKKSKNLLVICGSPRHSDWLLPRRTGQYRLPWLLFPWRSRSEEPCPRPEVLSDLWQLWRVYGVSSPRGEKLGFLKWESGTPRAEFPVSPSESGFCFLWKRERQRSRDLGPVGPVKWHLPSCRHSCSSIPDGSRKKQKPEQGAGGSHNPTRETKNKTEYRKSRKA